MRVSNSLRNLFKLKCKFTIKFQRFERTYFYLTNKNLINFIHNECNINPQQSIKIQRNNIYNLSTLNQLENLNEKIFLKDKYDLFRYENIFNLSVKLKEDLINLNGKSDLNEEKVAILCSNNYTYLISILGVWLANGVPVPLNKNYTSNYIEYFLNDSNAKLLINSIDNKQQQEEEGEHLSNKSQKFPENLKIPIYNLNENEFFRQMSTKENPNFNLLLNYLKEIKFNKDNHKDALIIYTSGSSGPSKGVVLTFSNLFSYIESLIDCWKLDSTDCVLHVLPLNHVHGLIYSLLAPFFSGAQVEMLSKFDAGIVWHKLLDRNNQINILTAVPTIYVKLIEYYNLNEEFKSLYNRQKLADIIRNKMRIMASASAPLNIKTFNQWFNLTGYQLVERYGMTEIGLGLSNSCEENEFKKRVAGTVGRPHGDVKIRLRELKDSEQESSSSEKILIESNSKEDKILETSSKKSYLIGELEVAGPMVFKEYLNKPKLTQEAFTSDGWFKTGDIAKYMASLKVYKIIGRKSIDLIKSGGIKISALDIEKEILAYPYIEDVAVMGIKDDKFGERILALLVLKPDCSNKFDTDEFLRWCRLRLPKYSLPKVIKIVEKMPRNQMGKVNKKELKKIYANKL